MIDLRSLHEELLAIHGPVGHWWPMAAGRIEQAVGAVLVQQNRWESAQVSIEALRDAGLLDAHALADAAIEQVAELIRPSGLVTAKSRALPALGAWMRDHETEAEGWDDDALCASLRALPLVGPETADVAMIYSYSRPRFITDAYARRLLAARGVNVPRGYDGTARALAPAWGAAAMNSAESAEFHGLIVEHGKRGYLAREEEKAA